MPKAKAFLVELGTNFQAKPGGKKVEVQFNPETMKVTFSNQLTDPPGAGNMPGGTAKAKPAPGNRQYVGQGTTKLTLQLWFDVNATLPKEQTGTSDVRNLTKEVAYFITPTSTDDQQHFTIPLVQFLWGSFHFNGVIESLDESLEFFSDDGRPLRANMSLNLTQQKIEKFEGSSAPAAMPPGGTGSGGTPTGTRPLAQAPAGTTLQNLADAVGKGDWQSIAAANGIENPRLLSPGQLIDLNTSVSAGASALSVRLGGG